MMDEHTDLKFLTFASIATYRLNQIVTAMRLMRIYAEPTTKVALKAAARLMEVPDEEFTEARVAQEIEFLVKEELAGKQETNHE